MICYQKYTYLVKILQTHTERNWTEKLGKSI